MSNEVKDERLRELIDVLEGRRFLGNTAQLKADRDCADALIELLALRPQREDAGAGGGVVLHRLRDIGSEQWGEWRLGPANLSPAFPLEWEDATFYAAPQPSAPEGWVLVPRKPTPEMLRAGMDDLGWWVEPYEAPRESGVPIESDISADDAAKINAQQIEVIADTYRAMLAASPSPPTGRDATEEGWVEWKGRGRPVFDDDRVFIRNRNGDEFAVIAGGVRWIHTGVHTDIIAYRLAAPKPETAQKGSKP